MNYISRDISRDREGSDIPILKRVINLRVPYILGYMLVDTIHRISLLYFKNFFLGIRLINNLVKLRKCNVSGMQPFFIITKLAWLQLILDSYY